MDDEPTSLILIEYLWQHATTQTNYAARSHNPPKDPIPDGWHEEMGGDDIGQGPDGAWAPFAAVGNVVHWRRLIWRPRVFEEGGEE